MLKKKSVKKLVKAKTGVSVKKGCPRGQCGTPPNCYDCPDNTRVSNTVKKGTPDLRATKVTIKKPTAQLAAKNQVKPTADSTAHFQANKNLYYKQAEIDAKYGMRKKADEMMKKASQASKDETRQKLKGLPGFDKNGFPIKKNKKGGVVKSKKKK